MLAMLLLQSTKRVLLLWIFLNLQPTEISINQPLPQGKCFAYSIFQSYFSEIEKKKCCPIIVAQSYNLINATITFELLFPQCIFVFSRRFQDVPEQDSLYDSTLLNLKSLHDDKILKYNSDPASHPLFEKYLDSYIRSSEGFRVFKSIGYDRVKLSVEYIPKWRELLNEILDKEWRNKKGELLSIMKPEIEYSTKSRTSHSPVNRRESKSRDFRESSKDSVDHDRDNSRHQRDDENRYEDQSRYNSCDPRYEPSSPDLSGAVSLYSSVENHELPKNDGNHSRIEEYVRIRRIDNYGSPHRTEENHQRYRVEDNRKSDENQTSRTSDDISHWSPEEYSPAWRSSESGPSRRDDDSNRSPYRTNERQASRRNYDFGNYKRHAHSPTRNVTRSRSRDRSSEREHYSNREEVSPARKKARKNSDIDCESSDRSSSSSRDVTNIFNEKRERRTRSKSPLEVIERDKNERVNVVSTLFVIREISSKLGPLCIPIPHLISQAEEDVLNYRDPMESFKSEDLTLFNMILVKISSLANCESISIVEKIILQEAENQLSDIVKALNKTKH